MSNDTKQGAATTAVPKIYKAISDVMRDVCETGIGKNNKNKDQGFNFRGIDDAMNALAPLLVKRGIVCLPRHGNAARFDRITKSGGTLSFVTITSEFDLVHVEDASSVTVVTNGEGMDSSDKATNKAMSTAFKYALFQTFVVPTMAVEIDDSDGGLSEAEQEAERQAWISDEHNRLRASTTNIEGLKRVWQEVKKRCEAREDREAAEELLRLYKRLAGEIADRTTEERQ